MIPGSDGITAPGGRVHVVLLVLFAIVWFRPRIRIGLFGLSWKSAVGKGPK